MELQEYKQLVQERYTSLPEDEKVIMNSIAGTPVGDVLDKVFGPEMNDLSVDEPIEEPSPMPQNTEQDQMQNMGLGI
jgi:hypothetical protein